MENQKILLKNLKGGEITENEKKQLDDIKHLLEGDILNKSNILSNILSSIIPPMSEKFEPIINTLFDYYKQSTTNEIIYYKDDAKDQLIIKMIEKVLSPQPQPTDVSLEYTYTNTITTQDELDNVINGNKYIIKENLFKILLEQYRTNNLNLVKDISTRGSQCIPNEKCSKFALDITSTSYINSIKQIDAFNLYKIIIPGYQPISIWYKYNTTEKFDDNSLKPIDYLAFREFINFKNDKYARNNICTLDLLFEKNDLMKYILLKNSQELELIPFKFDCKLVASNEDGCVFSLLKDINDIIYYYDLETTIIDVTKYNDKLSNYIIINKEQLIKENYLIIDKETNQYKLNDSKEIIKDNSDNRLQYKEPKIRIWPDNKLRRPNTLSDIITDEKIKKYIKIYIKKLFKTTSPEPNSTYSELVDLLYNLGIKKIDHVIDDIYMLTNDKLTKDEIKEKLLKKGYNWDKKKEKYIKNISIYDSDNIFNSLFGDDNRQKTIDFDGNIIPSENENGSDISQEERKKDFIFFPKIYKPGGISYYSDDCNITQSAACPITEHANNIKIALLDNIKVRFKEEQSDNLVIDKDQYLNYIYYIKKEPKLRSYLHCYSLGKDFDKLIFIKVKKNEETCFFKYKKSNVTELVDDKNYCQLHKELISNESSSGYLVHPNLIKIYLYQYYIYNYNIYKRYLFKYYDDYRSIPQFSPHESSVLDLSFEQYKELSLMLLNVVKHIQDNSCVHTDIAPQNILIKNDNTDLILIDIDDIDQNGKRTRNLDITIVIGVYNNCFAFKGGITWYMSYDTAAVCYIIITFLLWNTTKGDNYYYNQGSHIQQILSPFDTTQFINLTISELNNYYTSSNTMARLLANPFTHIIFNDDRSFVSKIYKGITFVPTGPDTIEKNPKYNLCKDIIASIPK